MKTALIGYGQMGRNHYRIIKELGGFELVAVCDTAANIPVPERVYNNVNDMLEHEDIQAAIISVPTQAHKDVSLACIERGINLLIEKPVANNISEAEAIKQAIDARGIKAAVGHVERFNPVVHQLLSELKDKEILSINITRVGPFPPRMSDVGILVDLSVHDIDLIRLISDFKNINDISIFKSVKLNATNTDNAILSFKLENDIVACITTNWLTPYKKRTIEVATKEAYYEANLMTQELVEYSSYQRNNAHLVRECFVRKREPLFLELKAFADYCKTGSRSYLATVEDSIYTLKTIQAL